MEPITVFAASVGLLGICRLTFAAVDFLSKGYSNRKDKAVKREDWYCFFRPSHLLGTQEQEQVSTPRDSLERRRRLEQQRPRPQAERSYR